MEVSKIDPVILVCPISPAVSKKKKKKNNKISDDFKKTRNKLNTKP